MAYPSFSPRPAGGSIEVACLMHVHVLQCISCILIISKAAGHCIWTGIASRLMPSQLSTAKSPHVLLGCKIITRAFMLAVICVFPKLRTSGKKAGDCCISRKSNLRYYNSQYSKCGSSNIFFVPSTYLLANTRTSAGCQILRILVLRRKRREDSLHGGRMVMRAERERKERGSL